MATAADSSTTLSATTTAKPVRGILKNTSSFDRDGHAVEYVSKVFHVRPYVPVRFVYVCDCRILKCPVILESRQTGV